MHLALWIELEQHALPYLRQVVRHKLSSAIVQPQHPAVRVALRIAAVAVRRADRRRIAVAVARRVVLRVALREVRRCIVVVVPHHHAPTLRHRRVRVAVAHPIRVEETLVADSF